MAAAARMSTRRGRSHVALVTLSLAAGLAAGGVAGPAPGALAVSRSVAYACLLEGLTGGFTLPVVLDTDAPARLTTGQTAQPVVTAAAGLPPRARDVLAVDGATHVDGSWTLDSSLAATGVLQSVPLVPLTAGSVALTASSGPVAYVAPAAPGAVVVTAGSLTGTLQPRDAAGAAVGDARTLQCAPPDGTLPVVDTIAVIATSTTTLTLDRTTSEHGRAVTATATVATSGGVPDGAVAFSLDGLATSARVGPDGVATTALPGAGVGPHTVTATFVPREPTAYDGSTAAPQALTVTRAGTRLRVRVTGRTTRLATRVRVRARGDFGTVPTGRVRITLTRLGRRGTSVEARALESGVARAGFGRLPHGPYRVVVIYRGDAEHSEIIRTRQFRVKRA